MMIPERQRADLPAGHAWAIRDENGQLTVYINQQVPADSPLEQELVREAARAWRAHEHRRTALPILIAAPGGWISHHARLAAGAGAGIAAAGTLCTAAVITTPTDPPNRPRIEAEAEAVAPPVDPTARIPPKRALHHPRLAAASGRPGHPSPSPDTSDTPAPDRPVTGKGGGPLVSVTIRPPRKPAGGGQTPAPQPVCRLVDLGVGHLVRVCL